jgi:hypothetical protein
MKTESRCKRYDWAVDREGKVLSVFEASTSNLPHPLDFPTSPQPPLPPQPPRIALSPSVMHAPPSAWPQHHTLLDVPVFTFTLSDAHSQPLSSKPQPLSLSLLDRWTTSRLLTSHPHASLSRTHGPYFVHAN